MANYAVESKRQPMVATGIVDQVKEWEDKPEGGRRQSERQARDEATGFPLWGVEVLYPQTAFGRTSTVTAKVTVASLDEPAPGELVAVGFAGLRVEVRVNKAGGFSESWSAESIATPPPAISGRSASVSVSSSGAQDKAA
jgi:hypothetical protein